VADYSAGSEAEYQRLRGMLASSSLSISAGGGAMSDTCDALKQAGCCVASFLALNERIPQTLNMLVALCQMDMTPCTSGAVYDSTVVHQEVALTGVTLEDFSVVTFRAAMAAALSTPTSPVSPKHIVILSVASPPTGGVAVSYSVSFVSDPNAQSNADSVTSVMSDPTTFSSRLSERGVTVVPSSVRTPKSTTFSSVAASSSASMPSSSGSASSDSTSHSEETGTVPHSTTTTTKTKDGSLLSTPLGVVLIACGVFVALVTVFFGGMYLRGRPARRYRDLEARRIETDAASTARRPTAQTVVTIPNPLAQSRVEMTPMASV
jgi:hypothetical protein